MRDTLYERCRKGPKGGERCRKVPKGAKPDHKGPNKSSVFQGTLSLEHIISGAHFLQGIFSLRVFSFRGTLPSRAQCLRGMLSPGPNCLRGTLSAGAHCLPGHIISRGIYGTISPYLQVLMSAHKCSWVLMVTPE